MLDYDSFNDGSVYRTKFHHYLILFIFSAFKLCNQLKKKRVNFWAL